MQRAPPPSGNGAARCSTSHSWQAIREDDGGIVEGAIRKAIAVERMDVIIASAVPTVKQAVSALCRAAGRPVRSVRGLQVKSVFYGRCNSIYYRLRPFPEEIL